MQMCLTKFSVILEIDPYVISLDFFNERIITATSNFHGMSAKNDSLLQIKGIVRIITNSKYLDRNVRWVLFILADYIYMMYYYIISFKTIFIGYPAFLFRPSIDMQLFCL